jgi:hypothetical protein
VSAQLHISAAILQERAPVPTEKEARRAQNSSGRFEKKTVAPTGIQTTIPGSSSVLPGYYTN